MRQIVEDGFICVKDKYDIEYVVCKLTYFLNEDETYKYEFRPNYSVISLLNYDYFQGIPGLNLDLKREVYIRDNINPCFITERVPQPNREDFYELLDEVDLDCYDPIEYLIRTDKKYSGDNFYMIRTFEKQTINLNSEITTQNNVGIMRLILTELAHGNDVLIDDFLIDDNNRESVFKTLIFLYEKSIKHNKEKQLEGVSEAIFKGKYKGRKPKEVDLALYSKVMEQVENKEFNVKDACNILGISKDKYYRMRSVYKNK